MLQVILLLLGIYHLYLTFQAIRDCILADAYEAARNQVIIMFINIAFVVYVIYTRNISL